MIGGQGYWLYKFLKVKTLERLIVFESNIVGQWPSLHDAGNGILFDSSMEIENISANWLVIWSPIVNKTFKLKLEGTLITKIEEKLFCLDWKRPEYLKCNESMDFDMKRVMKFMSNLLSLNLLNEMDRRFLFLATVPSNHCFIRFGGRNSVGLD
jgi:hypothetical protein